MAAGRCHGGGGRSWQRGRGSGIMGPPDPPLGRSGQGLAPRAAEGRGLRLLDVVSHSARRDVGSIPMLSRTIGSLLRGSSKPMQLLLAALLGALMGFVPVIREQPALLVAYVLLLLVANASIGLTLLTAGLTKLAALAAMPLAFAIGRWLVDGPARPFFAWAVNAPVLALLDLDVYAVSGGIVLGLATGALWGVVLIWSVTSFRRRLASVEASSEAYGKLVVKPWMKLLLWLLLGKRKTRLAYSELLVQGFGSPIRVVGVVIVGLIVGAAWFSPSLLGGGFLASAARSSLESIHGATVDVGDVTLDIAEGKLAVDGLAFADPQALDKDLFRAARLEADGSLGDLLRGRLSLDKLVLVDVVQGSSRSTPGQIVVSPEAPPAAPEPAAAAGVTSGTIGTWVQDADQLQARLSQVREWMEQLSPDEPAADAVAAGQPAETLDERLRREVERVGWGRVASQGLRTGAPAFLVRELQADGIRTEGLGDELVDLKGSQLSSDPALVDAPAKVSLRSRAGSLSADLGLGGKGSPPADNVVRLALHGLSGDTVGAMLGGKLKGGTVDLDLDGTWDAGQVGRLDVPLHVTLRNVVVDVVGGPRQVGELKLPFGIRGSLDNPSIRFEDKALTDALMSQAKAQVEAVVDEKKAELEQKAKEKTDEATEKAKKKLGDKLGGLLGGDKDGDG